MRLGLFGGSFDPVHYGHLLLAECCLEQCCLDEVWFLPAGVPPHKQDRELTPAEQRIEMLELAIAGHERFTVSRYDVQREGVSYTVDALRHFGDLHAEAQLFFLMGADMLSDLPNWREAEIVCELAILVVACRASLPEPNFGALTEITSVERIELFRRHRIVMPHIDLSSTEIRRRASQGLSIRYRTPRAVEKYIRTHHLYV